MTSQDRRQTSCKIQMQDENSAVYLVSSKQYCSLLHANVQESNIQSCDEDSGNTSL